ncbi:Mediator of RNA polymerase II transcription subunit 13 [Papilio machaon]|uniref:Mediator of RNA polymerase II transcription subunit 13 n=1 Tax=Papilio machaon TaxID=76193 RepID=A0A194RMP7_PAPMA|nr:Mediator of RNA polymerase II transcription subunit 13 [Papilio machaon]
MYQIPMRLNHRLATSLFFTGKTSPAMENSARPPGARMSRLKAWNLSSAPLQRSRPPPGHNNNTAYINTSLRLRARVACVSRATTNTSTCAPRRPLDVRARPLRERDEVRAERQRRARFVVARRAGDTAEGDHGSWESGLSYECRSLLFKALHNLIERCLLSRDFVRLGKWFVQPYDGDEEDVGKSPWHLSFSFAFFLHGESTVCASVDVRQHPPVRTLTAKRLARLARLAADDAPRDTRDARPDAAQHANVILAPFGLEGRVTGREWSDGDAATARLLDAWRQLYPLEHGCGAVEVECGGVRMRYPLPYALLTEMETPAAAPPPAAAALAGRTLRALTTPHPHQTAELCYGEAVGDKSEDFADPTRKTPCSCAK